MKKKPKKLVDGLYMETNKNFPHLWYLIEIFGDKYKIVCDWEEYSDPPNRCWELKNNFPSDNFDFTLIAKRKEYINEGEEHGFRN